MTSIWHKRVNMAQSHELFPLFPQIRALSNNNYPRKIINMFPRNLRTENLLLLYPIKRRTTDV